MANTYTLKSSSYDGRYLKLSCTQTQNIVNNTSTIKWTLTSTGGSSNYYSVGPTTVKINGEQAYYKARVSYSAQSFPAAKGSTSGSIVVKHNDDGSLSIPVSLTTAIYTTATSTASGTWTLDKIPRGATISSAPNFTDEDNPVMKYNNPLGSSVTSLQACIAGADGVTIYVSYRDISKTGTSYTFSLTTAERDALRNATPNSNTMTVKFYIKTVTDGATFYSSVSKTLTIKNPAPTVDPTVLDTNPTSILYTGDEKNKVIKGYNTMAVTFGASAIKGATIKSQKVTCGGKSRTTDGNLSNVESGTFTFSVTDSRGNTTTKTITKTLVEYFKPTINIGSLALTPEGVMSFSLNGTAFNGSFGATINSIVVRYRYKVSGGSWGSYTTITATKNGSSYSASGSVSGLDYKKTYVFQALIRDTVYPYDSSAITTGEKSIFSMPIFDWSAEDFNFNVPVSFQGNQMVDFIVDQGTEAMGSNGTWYWSKWASGKAECYGCRNYGNMAANTAWGNLYRSEVFSQSLPSGLFKSTPEVIDITFRNSSSGAWISKHETSAPSASSSGSFIVVRPASTSSLSQAYISFNIIGRWK